MGTDGVFGEQRGEIFLDTRDDGRALRLSWHQDQAVVVFSLWRGPGPGSTCVGTFRLPIDEVPALIQFLVNQLAASAGEGRSWTQAG